MMLSYALSFDVDFFEEAAVSTCDLSPLNPVNILLFRCFTVVGGNNLFSGIYKWEVCFSPSIMCS